MGGGGGKKYHFPKYVWAQDGGWFNATRVSVEQARFNTHIAHGLVLVLGACVFYYSIQHERRKPGLRPIPSQRWSTHTLDDDPEYPKKLKEYHANKEPLWKRIFPV